MKIYDFSKEADRSTLEKMFQGHFKRRDIVPFFGSGFTRGLRASGGLVPSMEELKGELTDIIAGILGVPDDGRAELERMNLSKLGELFWPTLEQDKTPQSYRDRFDTYVDSHFCGVHDLPVQHRRLINCRWRYLYTLNYDDAIEGASDKLEVLVPYSGQNRKWLEKKRCLYKIHGDAAKFLRTGESKYFIMSRRQYLTAIKDEMNQAMRHDLETDFSSNSLIFFGCSLLDELDILLAADMKLTQEKQRNTDTHSYYVRYVIDGAESLSEIRQLEFQNFAITDIIEVRAEDMQRFYSFLVKISDEVGKLQETDSLTEFTGFQFLQQESTDRDNIEYLFFSSRIRPQAVTKQIVLPSFFIRRDVTQQIVNAVNAADGHFHILRGGRLSGKTYALVDLLKEFRTRNTYYFPSDRQISDQCFERLLSMKNAILIFDEHSITNDQLAEVTAKYRTRIQNNEIQVVTAVDRSTGTFTRHYFDRFPELEGFVKIYSLSSSLNADEAARFNEEFGQLGLRDYECDWSLLDFMLEVDDASTQKHGFGLPDINIVQNRETLKALILFANQESIPVSQGSMMNINETLYDLCKTAGVAIQKDYLSEAELAPNTHDSFRFVVNSKYWVYKCLSTYAQDNTHYAAIGDAFYAIVKTIQRQYDGRFTQSYYQTIKPYYFFDTIQFTFFPDPRQSGSLFLPDVIYKKLLPLLKDDFQFLHQKAKCLLWNSKRKKDIKGRAAMLNEALQQITRARSLAEKRAPVNKEYTLYHMDVTKALILANNWRYCRSEFNEAEQSEQLSLLLKAFYNMEEQMLDWGNDPDLDDQEMRDLNWFVFHMVDPSVLQCILPGDRSIAGHIMTSWRQKNSENR